MPTSETFSQSVLGFSIPERNVRGRLVRLDTLLNDILAAHAYPAPIAHLLAEALVVTALMGGLVNTEGGQVTLQAQTQGGPVALLVCDWKDGALRGYVDFDAERVEPLGANPDLAALFGTGYLAITFDLPVDRGRYQGIVPLEGASLSEACERYFVQSEQIPTAIKVAVGGANGTFRAAGMVLQHLPDGEVGRERLHVRLDDPEWDHVRIMGSSLRHDELLDPDLSLEAIVWRLFHEETEVRTQEGLPVARGCRCSVEHYHAVLSRFPEADRAEMRDDNGAILVDCAFCSRQFAIEV